MLKQIDESFILLKLNWFLSVCISSTAIHVELVNKTAFQELTRSEFLLYLRSQARNIKQCSYDCAIWCWNLVHCLFLFLFVSIFHEALPENTAKCKGAAFVYDYHSFMYWITSRSRSAQNTKCLLKTVFIAKFCVFKGCVFNIYFHKIVVSVHEYNV